MHLDELVKSCPEPINLDLFFYDTKINMPITCTYKKCEKKDLTKVDSLVIIIQYN